jgi:hypothetical protein
MADGDALQQSLLELAERDEQIATQANQIEGLQTLVAKYQSELASLRTSGTDVDDYVYENQRWYPPGRWSTELLPTERPSWSNEEGTEERDFNSVKLPDETWQWVGQWIIQQTTNGAGESDADPDGWMYGLTLNATNKPDKKWNSTVRRRKWARRRVKVTSTEEGATPEANTQIQSTVLIATLEQEVMRLMSENRRLSADAEQAQAETDPDTGVSETSNMQTGLAKAKANASAGAETAAANIQAGAGIVGAKISSVRETMAPGISSAKAGASQKLSAFGAFMSDKGTRFSAKVNERVTAYQKGKQGAEGAEDSAKQQQSSTEDGGSSSGGGGGSSGRTLSSSSSNAGASETSPNAQDNKVKALLDLGVDEEDLDEL